MTAAVDGTDPEPIRGRHDAEGYDAGHAAHGSGASHGSGHEEAGEPLGPVDVVAWGYALAGAAIGLVTAAALYVASTA